MNKESGIVHILGIVGVLALVLVLPVAVFLVGQNQNPDSQASTNNLVPDGATGYVVEDAYVDSDTPSKGYGSEGVLWTDGESEKISYIKLNLEKLAGKTISSAILRMYVARGSSSPVSVVNVSASSWTSSDITYSVRPLTGEIITTVDASEAGQWADVDLTQFVQQNAGKVVSIALLNDDPGGLSVNSLEAPFDKLELVVVE